MKKKSFIGVLPAGSVETLSENLKYTFPGKAQNIGTDEYERKAPQDEQNLLFEKGPKTVEVQFNDALKPTVLPTDMKYDKNNKSNTSFKDLDNPQVGDEDLSSDANRSGVHSMLINESNFKGIIDVNDLLKKADLLPGGKGDDFDINEIPKKELAMGMEVESEHTPNPELQKEIVSDHEKETMEFTGEPNYYEDYLIPMEEEMKEEGKEKSFEGVTSVDELMK